MVLWHLKSRKANCRGFDSAGIWFAVNDLVNDLHPHFSGNSMFNSRHSFFPVLYCILHSLPLITTFRNGLVYSKFYIVQAQSSMQIRIRSGMSTLNISINESRLCDRDVAWLMLPGQLLKFGADAGQVQAGVASIFARLLGFGVVLQL